MSLSKGQIDRDCTEKCKSIEHGNIISSVITKRGITDADICAYIRWKCTSCGQVCDSMGRTALHFAASCGRSNLVKWLIKTRNASINLKDLESGYTALHRSIFYGKINTAVTLMQLGANINILDHNDLNPIEHAVKDRNIKFSGYSVNEPCQVYVWGTNTNYTLGIGSQHARQQPDLHDAFHKKYTNVSVSQVCMAKFHSVIVTLDGRIFSCGHGQGGRLGLNTESTVLIPQEIKFHSSVSSSMGNLKCVQASIARDHSLFLLDSGEVMSCGLNVHHVLGVKPPPAQLLVPKSLPEFRHNIVGICSGRFHSVAWGPNALYTWGLHAGQLGHDRSPATTYVTPKLIQSFLNCEIISVAASDGATVVATKKGDVLVLHEYQIRKIASRQLSIEKVFVVGGHLNAKVSNDVLTEKGGNELKILVLQKTGNILLWQESVPQLSRCIYSLNRSIIVRDVALSRTELFFVTNEGEAFKGEFRPRKIKKSQSDNLTMSTGAQKTAFHEFLEKDDCQIVKIHKLPNIHRAVRIHCDLKGRNFAVIQNAPHNLLVDVPEISPFTMTTDMAVLLDNTDELDTIHDIIFKIGTVKFPAHKFIVATHSDPLNCLIESSLHSGSSSSSSNEIELTNINPLIFKQILKYIYTKNCDLFTCGECSINVKHFEKKSSENYDIFNIDDDDNDNDADENVAAFEIYNGKNNSVIVQKQKQKSSSKSSLAIDPVRLLQQAAKRFGIKSLYSRLDNYIFANGYIKIKSANNNNKKNVGSGGGGDAITKNTFDRYSFKNFYDVIVKSKSGAEIPAHKCILASRLEYFNNLFALRWNENNSKRTTISLPISFSVLETLLDYLYTDDASDLRQTDDIDHIINVLIVADQLFVNRLKEICEVALSGLLNLKNTVYMLQFATIYNAVQLKRCSMEFICLNLSALLESRSLEVLDDDILNDLANYYCSWNDVLSKRVITPFSDAPTDDDVKNIYDTYPINLEDELITTDQQDSFERKTTKLNSRKKGRTRKNSSNSENTRSKTLSDSSNLDNSFDSNNTSATSEILVGIQERNATPEDEKWVKILSEKQKHQKIIQTRLKAIALAKIELESEQVSNEPFTKLVSSPKIIPKSVQPKPSSPVLYKSPNDCETDKCKSPPIVYEIPIQKTQKLSQKQRKKLAADQVSGNVTPPDSDKMNKKQSWNKFVWSKDQNSFADIMKGETTKTSGTSRDYPELSTSSPKSPWQKLDMPSPTTSNLEEKHNFQDIIADERKQKENWTKMRSRPLIYSQMEDKAVSDLEKFYNIDQVSDEYITIHKVETCVFAVPLWVHSNTKH